VVVELQPLKFKRAVLDWKRTYLMGVINMTPDSFSDGGRFASAEEAGPSATQLSRDGADIIDVGGESTRPGERADVPAAEERKRVLPLIQRLEWALISVDTCKAEVADAALAAGAEIVNDVSGGKRDPKILHVAARREAAIILGHWREWPGGDASAPYHGDIVHDVVRDLGAQVARAVEAGVARERILVDPGLGFGKTGRHNLELLMRLDELTALGCPIVVGASRKSFLGHITKQPVDRREVATSAAHTAAILHGANIVRVHDPLSQRDAVRVADALRYRSYPS
jgi:dihydropteroate synthase